MEKDKKTLLVPYDFTHMGDYALNHAIRIAKTLKYDVCLFHVINKEFRSRIKRNELPENYAEIELQKIIKKANNNYVNIRYLIKEGSIFTEIAVAAKETSSHFVVMGTHGKTGIQHITGSWALKVIASAEAPFIVIQRNIVRNSYKNIVFPIDNSEESKQKMKWAIHIAKTFNSTVHIFYINASEKSIAIKIYRNVKQIINFFNENGIKYYLKEKQDKNSNFAKAVVNYAASVSADLIMIMAEPDPISPIFHWGKWDEQILFNSAKIPVMCINPRDFGILNYQVYG